MQTIIASVNLLITKGDNPKTALRRKRNSRPPILRDHESELKVIGVLSVSVFGSTAQGDAGPHSDVDVAVRLANTFSSGGFDYFGRLDELEQQLSRLLDCKVDVVAEPVRKTQFQHEIDRDRTLAF